MPPLPTGQAHCPRPSTLHSQSFHFLATETFYFSKLVRPRLTLLQLMVEQSGRGLPRGPPASTVPNPLVCLSGMKTSWPTHSREGIWKVSFQDRNLHMVPSGGLGDHPPPE